MSDKILLVDDDSTLLDTLALNLRNGGFRVVTASDGVAALEQARLEQPDVIILDLMLPELDGLTVCRTLRQASDVPILILTARTGELDKIIGLESGADDYLTKPFSLGELQARLRALLRRANPGVRSDEIRSGDLVLNLISRRAFTGARELLLTPREFSLLVELIHHKGAVLTRDLLLSRIWGYDFFGDTRTVDVHIRWLREKIEADPANPTRITTVRGIGYRVEGVMVDTSLLLGLLLGSILVSALLSVRASRASRAVQVAARGRAEAIEARSELQRELDQWRAHLAALGRADVNGLLLLDADRRILWGNPGAWELFNCAEPAIGQPFIVLAGDAELHQTVVDAIQECRPMVRQTARRERTLRMCAAPIAETGGAAVSIADVTELQRLGRARRDLIGNISHELRKPLTNIALAAQTLRNEDAVEAGLRQKLLDQIESQVETLSQLSQEMTDLAQIESGQVLLRLIPVEVEPLLRTSMAALLPQSVSKGQSISVSVTPGLVALADDRQVTRVIGNLVHNAIKFTPDGGAITIRAEAAGDDVLICVADTGTGIPQAEQMRVFERFYKADRARSKGGTGLGLAIARHIVEGHGGRIWVESPPGQGAKFSFTLPRA